MNKKNLCALMGLFSLLSVNNVALADEPFIGEVRWFAGTFAPRGWAFCDGQLMPINQNQALFSLLGSNYGGDGRTTFALPDLRGRAMLHEGRGAGLSTYNLGQKGGEETHELTADELPDHSHSLLANKSNRMNTSPEDAYPARSGIYGESATVNMKAGAITDAGGSQSHTNMMPTIALNCIIATQGLFPSRN